GRRSLLSHFSTLRISFLSRHIPNPAGYRLLRSAFLTGASTAIDLPPWVITTGCPLRTSSSRAVVFCRRSLVVAVFKILPFYLSVHYRVYIPLYESKSAGVNGN